MNTLHEIEARHAELVAEAEQILDGADGDLAGDELARYEQLLGELDRLARRRQLITRIAEQAPAGEPGDGATGGLQLLRRTDPFDLADRRLVGPEVRSRALTALERVDLSDQARERVAGLVERVDLVDGRLARHVVCTGRPAYRTGWLKLVSGQAWAVTAEEQQAIAEARAASLTPSAGGYAVPFTLDPTFVLTSGGAANPFRRIARVVTTVTDDWNGVTSAGVTASWDAEGVEVSDDAPTLAQPSIPVHKAAAFVPFSIEIGQDWPAMEADLREAFADAKDRLEGQAFAVGTGSGQPTGVVTALVAASSPVIASATTDTFAVADVYATLEKCPPRHRSSGSWVANLGILNRIRQFGTANNYSGFTVDLTAAGVPQLLGRPVYESSDMDGTITASADNYVLVYGDFSRYVIVDRVGMSVELVPHLFGTNRRPTGQRGLYAYWRTGAGVIDPGAFAVLNVT